MNVASHQNLRDLGVLGGFANTKDAKNAKTLGIDQATNKNLRARCVLRVPSIGVGTTRNYEPSILPQP